MRSGARISDPHETKTIGRRNHARQICCPPGEAATQGRLGGFTLRHADHTGGQHTDHPVKKTVADEAQADERPVAGDRDAPEMAPGMAHGRAAAGRKSAKVMVTGEDLSRATQRGRIR